MKSLLINCTMVFFMELSLNRSCTLFYLVSKDLYNDVGIGNVWSNNEHFVIFEYAFTILWRFAYFTFTSHKCMLLPFPFTNFQCLNPCSISISLIWSIPMRYIYKTLSSSSSSMVCYWLPLRHNLNLFDIYNFICLHTCFYPSICFIRHIGTLFFVWIWIHTW